MVGRRSIACPYQIKSQKETSHARETASITTGSARRINDLDANPKYKCIICDSRFYHKRSLAAHKLRHTDTLPKFIVPPTEAKWKTNVQPVKTKEQPTKNVWKVRLANIKRRVLNTLKISTSGTDVWPTSNGLILSSFSPLISANISRQCFAPFLSHFLYLHTHWRNGIFLLNWINYSIFQKQRYNKIRNLFTIFTSLTKNSISDRCWWNLVKP